MTGSMQKGRRRRRGGRQQNPPTWRPWCPHRPKWRKRHREKWRTGFFVCLTHPVALSSKIRRFEMCPVRLPACCFLPARSRPAAPPSSSSRLSPPLHRQRAAPAVLPLRLVPVFPRLSPVAPVCSRLSLQGGSGRRLLPRP